MSENPVSLIHVVRQPTTAVSGKPPLVVLLHGVGSNEEDLMGLAPFLDGRFLVVSLRAPRTIQRGAYGWYNVEWTANGIVHDEQGAEDGQAAAEQAIREIVVAYDADPTRVYLMGFSQGAIMSLGILLAHPETIAGAVIMSGRLLPHFKTATVDPELLSGFPVLVVHGVVDNVLPIKSGREIDAYLETLPVSLTYQEYPMAHTISQESLATITKWLTDQLDTHKP